MLGVLIYLPTLIFIPHATYLLSFPYLFLKKFHIRELINPSTILILAIVALSFINRLLKPSLMTSHDLIPFSILIILTYLISISLNIAAVRVIIYLVCIEIIIAWTQKVMGVSTFFTSAEGYEVFNNPNLLHASRPFGLSSNSSDIGDKALIALLLADVNRNNLKRYKLIMILLLSGLMISFIRSAIAAYLVFIIAKYLSPLIQSLLSLLALKLKRKHLQFIILVFVGVGLLTAAVVIYQEELIAQLTRNRGKIDLTNRGQIWELAIAFIKENWFFGNHSYKIKFYLYQSMNHAHNAYLQLFATHGLIISLLYLALITMNLRKSNIIYVLPILVYGLTQYAVFWGISLLDVFLFFFLFNTRLPRLNHGLRST